MRRNINNEYGETIFTLECIKVDDLTVKCKSIVNMNNFGAAVVRIAYRDGLNVPEEEYDSMEELQCFFIDECNRFDHCEVLLNGDKTMNPEEKIEYFCSEIDEFCYRWNLDCIEN